MHNYFNISDDKVAEMKINSNMEIAATIYYKTKTKLNINSSLLLVYLLLKLTDLWKQDSSKLSLHRAIALGKSVRFILFFHILTIFPFLHKLRKGQVGIFVLCVMMAFTSYTPRYHTAVCF